MKNTNKQNSSLAKKTSIGGQALMEGIMMKGPSITAMAVRDPNGNIVLEKSESDLRKTCKFFKLPIIRGVYNYIDSMVTGTKCLMRSAEISGLEEVEKELKKKNAESNKSTSNDELDNNNTAEMCQSDSECNSNATENEPQPSSKKKSEASGMMNAIMFFSVFIGIVFSVFLFIVIPSYLYKGASYLMPFLRPDNPALQSLIKCVFEGVLKIAILILYMAAISLMKDIRRTFMFHGAEHKTIFCYEKGLDLTVENVRMQKRFHPRCGTSFLILMLLVGIFVSFFVDPLYIIIFGHEPMTLIRVIIKLIILPLIVGIGYELIKLAGRHDNAFTRIISTPGVWLQHITVLEPDDSMIECAIAAIREVIPNDESDKW